MLQRYKLRLGDGTVLGVDQQGLQTWALDGKAMVQAAESHEWYPLREFLAAQYVAARRAARQRAREAPSGPPRPLPLVYPKPREDKAPPQEAPEPSEPPPFLAESSEIPISAEATPFITEPPVVPALTEPSEVQAFAEDPAEAEVLAAEPLVPQAVVEDPTDAPIVAEEPAPAVGASAEPTWIPDEGLSAPTPALPDREEDELSAAPFSAGEPGAPLLFDAPVPTQEAESRPSMLDEDFPLMEGAALPLPPPSLSELPELPELPEPPQAPVLPESPLASPRPSLQPLADDLATKRGGAVKDSWRPDDGLPIIPLKPLEDEPPSVEGAGTYEEIGDALDEAPRRSAFKETLIRWFIRAVSAYDALLTGWIDRLARRSRSTSNSGPTSHSANSVESLPLAPPFGLDVPPDVGVLAEEPTEARPEPVPPRSTTDLLSNEALQPPPPIRDLPVLRLADIPDEVETGEVYGRESRLPVFWHWTKRILVTAGLLGGVLFAALRFETWAPKAQVLGREVFSRIERIQESREQSERQRQALQEATVRLPHLAPVTLQLLISTSPTPVPDPPELFRLASDAADRGARTLTSAEVRELRRLRGELLKALRPSERERIREYDAARARRLVFPFEGRDVLELFERGAYALPQEDRERLQELYAKAIAAGLAASAEATPGPTAKP